MRSSLVVLCMKSGALLLEDCAAEDGCLPARLILQRGKISLKISF